MATGIKVISATGGGGTIYTCPAGKVAKIIVDYLYSSSSVSINAGGMSIAPGAFSSGLVYTYTSSNTGVAINNNLELFSPSGVTWYRIPTLSEGQTFTITEWSSYSLSARFTVIEDNA